MNITANTSWLWLNPKNNKSFPFFKKRVSKFWWRNKTWTVRVSAYRHGFGRSARKLRGLSRSAADGQRVCKAGIVPLRSSSLCTAGSPSPVTGPGPARELWHCRWPPGDTRSVESPAAAASGRAAGKGCARCWSPTLGLGPWFLSVTRELQRPPLNTFCSLTC